MVGKCKELANERGSHQLWVACATCFVISEGIYFIYFFSTNCFDLDYFVCFLACLSRILGTVYLFIVNSWYLIIKLGWKLRWCEEEENRLSVENKS